MNYKLMLRMLGRTLELEALCLLLPLFVALFYGEDVRPFLFTVIPVAAIGFALTRLKSRDDFFFREGFVVVGLIWLALSLFGTLPFVFSGELASFADCLFETVSGFTTTGATILTDIESLPRSLLFWRSFTSWIGGMGVLLFTLAFLPKVGGRTQVLVQAEVPGPMSSKLVPKTVQSSQILYLIYAILTGAEIIALKIAGLPFYDSVVTTFANVCTGGFSVKNASIAAYNLPACEIICIVFMIPGSLNFAVFFLAVTGRIRQAFKSDELRFFLLAIFFASLLVFCNICHLYDGQHLGRAALDAIFEVTATITTTGFSVTDYCLWPVFAQTILLLLMFFGGCAGSTTGSIKCARILLLLRCANRSILRLAHPRSVKVVKLDGKAVDEETLNTVYAFFICFFLVLAAGCVVVSLSGQSMAASLSAMLACLTNVGPAFDAVGPAGSYAGFSVLSKLVLSFGMLVGRLEIFPILILLSPATWGRS